MVATGMEVVIAPDYTADEPRRTGVTTVTTRTSSAHFTTPRVIDTSQADGLETAEPLLEELASAAGL